MVLRRQSQRPTEARSIILFFIAGLDPKRSIYIIIIVCIVDFYHCSWICYVPRPGARSLTSILGYHQRLLRMVDNEVIWGTN